MEVPFYNLDRLYQKHSREILKAVDAVFQHGQVLMGPEVEALEKNVAQRFGRSYAVAVGSCTDALFFALKAAGIGPGDEVLVTAFSFPASATTILRTGAVPVFVDIEPDYFMMDLRDLQKKITAGTKAIVGVSLFGQPLDMDGVEKVVQDNNLILIEDAAQALGSRYKNRASGTMGLCSCFSFDPTKVIGAFGNGGILLTDEEAVYSTVSQLRYHGKNSNGEYEILGYNSRLASSQAAIVNLQLEWLNEWIERRQETAARYTQGLQDIPQIQTPKVRPLSTHVFHKYVIKAEKRNELKDFLKTRGIQTMVHYSQGLNDCPVFGRVLPRSSSFEGVNQVKEEALSLPIYPELQSDEADYVVESIRQFYR